MNIFKILASGDGSIKEPNLSAFLAYLLNPKADHGLGSRFLQKVLQNFIPPDISELKKSNVLKSIWSTIDEKKLAEEAPYILDLSIYSRFNVNVLLEKALKINDKEKGASRNKTKEIVDIMIMITGHDKPKQEDITYLFNDEEPIALILLENKINACKDSKEQLSSQYQTSKSYFKEIMKDSEWKKWDDKIYTVFVHTDTPTMQKQFETFLSDPKGNRNSIHLCWNNKSVTNLDDSVKTILLDILKESSLGEIPPIPTYTEETIRSLINFIENDFSSNTDDQQHKGQPSTGTHYKTLDELWESKNCTISKVEFDRVKNIFENISERDNYKIPEHTKTHLLTFNSNNSNRLCSISTRSKHAVVLLLESTVNDKIKNELDRLEIKWNNGKKEKGDLSIKLDSFKRDEQVFEFIKFLYEQK